MVEALCRWAACWGGPHVAPALFSTRDGAYAADYGDTKGPAVKVLEEMMLSSFKRRDGKGILRASLPLDRTPQATLSAGAVALRTRHPLRAASVIAAVTALATLPACGHRPSFKDAAEAAFEDATRTATGTNTSTGTDTSTVVTEGCSTDPLQVVINGHDMMPGYNEPAKPEVDALMG
ncbi:MAG: hypothetical protein JW751_11205, partial [Polyangiaceae bacterium]|nr:hypothetical protein [Polyangiaceae bacterium]